jgi:hypothetical protein
MPNIEQGVPLQTDQLSTVPGGSIRTVTVTVPINGVPTPVQMQVIAIADANGVIADNPPNMTGLFSDILDVLEDIRVAVFRLADMPFSDSANPSTDIPGVRTP